MLDSDLVWSIQLILFLKVGIVKRIRHTKSESDLYIRKCLNLAFKTGFLVQNNLLNPGFHVINFKRLFCSKIKLV